MPEPGDSLDTLTTATEPTGRRDGQAAARPLLVRLLCADDPWRASARWRLDGSGEVRVCRGREGAAAAGEPLTVALPDPYVSTRHLRLLREERGWCAVDDGSTNGTWIDGRRLAPGERRPLREAALIEVGHTFLLFREQARGWARAAPVVDEAELEAGPSATLNPEWELALADAERLAATRHELLVEGESGAGKELVARWLHERSGRRGPLVSVNCAALPETLLDDELFGHVRGAYSGAQGEREGLFRAADGGTLFLDEIGDMSAPLQAKLLRVLEDGRVRPLGAEREVTVDVRVLAATHRDLRALVSAGKFRHDLLARLGLLRVRVPALRERREDLGLLVRGVLRGAAGGPERVRFELDAARLLVAHRWPLNVRELQRAVTAAVELAQRDAAGARVVTARQLSSALSEDARAAPRAAPPDALAPEERAARQRLEELLRRHAGNVAAVARELGAPRTQVQRRMARLGIDRLAAARQPPDPPSDGR